MKRRVRDDARPLEVLSPRSKRIARVLEPARHRDLGVPEYGVVDPTGRAIERHRRDTEPGRHLVPIDHLVTHLDDWEEP
jgi:Uma2 family endonuclease